MFNQKKSSLAKFNAAKINNTQTAKITGGADLKEIAEQLHDSSTNIKNNQYCN